MLILAILLFGMVVGAAAQLVLGSHSRGINWTTALVAGLLGSFIGGLLISLLSGDGLALRASGIIGSAATDPLLKEYYDTEWGMPVRDERGLFERLSLEAFQSGLSWATILRKRSAFRAAFDDFDPDAVAAYDDRDVERLMADTGIVRNRRKIDATITNARATVALREDGGLADLVWSFRPESTPTPASYAAPAR